MINEKEIILWCDVETTGTDANHDKLLQVAAVITDDRAEQILPKPFQMIVKHNNSSELRQQSVAIVQKMHDATHLWEKLKDGEELEIVDEELLKYITDNVPRDATVRLGGSSCRLDLNFIEAYLPKTYARLTYRFIDVSGLAFAFHSHGLTDGYMEKKKTHDAMDDITETIKEFKWLFSHVKKENN